MQTICCEGTGHAIQSILGRYSSRAEQDGYKIFGRLEDQLCNPHDMTRVNVIMFVCFMLMSWSAASWLHSCVLYSVTFPVNTRLKQTKQMRLRDCKVSTISE